LDNEASPEGTSWFDGGAIARAGEADLQGTRGGDIEMPRFAGKCSYVCVGSAAFGN